MTKKVLFVTYGGGHVNMLLPVMKELMDVPSIDLMVLGLTTAGSVLKRNKIPYLSFKDLLPLSNNRALDFGKKLVGLKSSSALVSYEESVAYMGLNFCELVESYGEEEADRLYKKLGRHAFYPINLMRKFFQQQCPDLVVSTNSPRTEKAAIHAAGQLNILSLCLIDLFAYQSLDWTGKPGYASKVCVLSEFVKKQLTDAGRLDSEVVVTGNPAFDSIAIFKENVNKYILNRKWANSRKVILWASQPEPELHPFDSNKMGDSSLPRKVEVQLFKVLSKHPDWQLVIRSHPSENTKYGDLPGNVEISLKSENLHELLASVDCVITMTSTVAIEAALMGKPVISIDLSIFTDDSPYSKMGLSQGIDNLEDLEQVIKGTTAELVDFERIKKVVGKNHNSTENIVSVIKSLLLSIEYNC
ncbi:MAG: hypothetical protein KC469_13030 [Flavobacteriaceae bacterium]|nr:hypothetical protein [Flavobacteriaceae bacterium]